MIITLSDTTSAQISSALLSARRSAGSPASGMVLTLIIVSDIDGYPAALDAAMSAGREHPCRILLMVTGNGRQAAGLDAEVRMGEDTPGEVVVVRMRGALANHPDSVLRPLLLPDSPVVVWRPGASPQHQTSDSLAELADRRITDASAPRQPRRELLRRAQRLTPGDVDLAWTRLTGWRTLLAAALDQFPAHVSRAVVEAERGNPSADLLAAWLERRLGCPVRQVVTAGPGITATRLTTAAGDIAITRPDGALASYAVPGQPNRLVALKRRTTADLIAEELRRMDRDPIYEQVLGALAQRGTARRRTSNRTTNATTAQSPAANAQPEGVAEPQPARKPSRSTAATTRKSSAKKSTAKESTAKKSTAKKASAPGTTSKRTTAPQTSARGSSSTRAGTQRSGAAKAATTKSPTKKAPTKKASTTKTPATKTPATKAPAKKAPATKAPATKAPAKRARQS